MRKGIPILIFASVLITFINFSCSSNKIHPEQEEESEDTLKPAILKVKTADITDITSSSTVGGGTVISHGGTTIINQEVCWDTLPDPTIGDQMVGVSDTKDSGRYTSNFIKLQETTRYYVRAYATNSQGTVYGQEVFFTTIAAQDDERKWVDSTSFENYQAFEEK